MTMFRKLRLFIKTATLLITILACHAIVEASGAPATDSATISSKDIIFVLYGLLQTIFMGIGVWLISNDKELFKRVSRLETDVAVMDKVCDERHENGDYPRRRMTDKA